MKRTLAALMIGAVCNIQLVLADENFEVDVVHFWVSNSESEALEVYRQAWTSAGNLWLDLPAKNQVAVQRIISERIASGYPPMVMQWHANDGSHELPKMGIVQDIEEVAQQGRWRDVLPAFVLSRISHDGKIYLAPTSIHTENWLWTSQSLFDELGLETPATWDDVFTAADRIQATGHLPIALGSGSWEISLMFNNIMYYTMGPEGYTRITGADAEAVLDSRMLEALDLLRRLSRYTDTVQARKGMTWADATAQVGRGEAGMQFMGDWAKGELTSLGYEVDRDFGCALIPGTSIAYFMVIDAFAFPLVSREGGYEAQQAFSNMVLEPENQVAFSRIKGSLPVRTDVDPSGLDRCGQLGMQMVANERHRVNAQSMMAMPTQMSEGWIGVLADFFNDETMSSEAAQQRLYQVIKPE